ncbi:hypothetical protein [Rhodovastum atsumiense]|uniref:Uncharacterized protein n=1 Tax=Rhodovastum atsumiense TaxID=504468 RepID=A0A5M6IW84_9PROT|nr:hypothetical protein F1189_13750 [Rhodovastum atsumiense]
MICGGESGPKARPMDPTWASRSSSSRPDPAARRGRA